VESAPYQLRAYQKLGVNTKQINSVGRKGKYLPLYYEWMKKGELPDKSLCNCFVDDDSLALFEPTKKTGLNLTGKGIIGTTVSTGGWLKRFQSRFCEYEVFLHPLPLRQTIGLLMAAI
jgi:hypothetical protein